MLVVLIFILFEKSGKVKKLDMEQQSFVCCNTAGNVEFSENYQDFATEPAQNGRH